MEEYEPHLAQGFLVFAGVDYGDILKAAEKEADVIACVRTIVFISYMTTNLFICAGVLRHWHD